MAHTTAEQAVAWAEEHLFDRRSVVREHELWRHALEHARADVGHALRQLFLALELAQRNKSVYMLNLEAHLSKDDLESILSLLKYCSTAEETVLCIDNPAADEEMLEVLLRRIPDYCSTIHILFAERGHRYNALQRTGCGPCPSNSGFWLGLRPE